MPSIHTLPLGPPQIKRQTRSLHVLISSIWVLRPTQEYCLYLGVICAKTDSSALHARDVTAASSHRKRVQTALQKHFNLSHTNSHVMLLLWIAQGVNWSRNQPSCPCPQTLWMYTCTVHTPCPQSSASTFGDPWRVPVADNRHQVEPKYQLRFQDQCYLSKESQAQEFSQNTCFFQARQDTDNCKSENCNMETPTTDSPLSRGTKLIFCLLGRTKNFAVKKVRILFCPPLPHPWPQLWIRACALLPFPFWGCAREIPQTFYT